MALQKSEEENFLMKGSIKAWLTKADQSLHKGNFTNIRTNQFHSQLTADYKK